MSSLSLFLVLISILLTGNDALNVEILEPIRASGDDVALIFTSGGFMKGEQYKKIAQAIQAASELRVWVALTGHHGEFSRSEYYLSPRVISEAAKALKKAGMDSDDYIGLAHGMGGEFPYTHPKESLLKAIVLLGSSLPRETKLQDFPLPLLTLAAELDGVTRITRMAHEFSKLKEDMLDSFKNMYRTPVIFLEGTNHAQFASGSVSVSDLPPDVTEEEAHSLIAKHINSFVTATFSSTRSLTDDAQDELSEAFSSSFENFQPFLDMKGLDLDPSGNVSQWTIMVQGHVAGEFADQIQVSNEVLQNPGFSFRTPSLTKDGAGVAVKTFSSMYFDLSGYHVHSARESPREISMKLKSKDAIWEALTVQDDGSHVDGPHTSLRSKPRTCKSLNEFALQVALNHTSPEARERYNSRGQPIIFEEDDVITVGFLWAMTPSKVWEDRSGYHVKASAFHTPITSRSNPGALYCKLISPFRAMEWISVESLRQFWKQ